MADFTRLLTQLRAKLDRQEKAVQDTKTLIAQLEATNRTK